MGACGRRVARWLLYVQHHRDAWPRNDHRSVDLNGPPLQSEKPKAAVANQRTGSVRVELIRSPAPQTGRASWYKLPTPTASGDAMDTDALTAAHPFLPLGVQVPVENLDNGRSVVVRINDRGPFAHNRIIDVSKAAAEKLDMIADGVANVRVSRVVGALLPRDRTAH